MIIYLESLGLKHQLHEIKDWYRRCELWTPTVAILCSCVLVLGNWVIVWGYDVWWRLIMWNLSCIKGFWALIYMELRFDFENEKSQFFSYFRTANCPGSHVRLCFPHVRETDLFNQLWISISFASGLRFEWFLSLKSSPRSLISNGVVSLPNSKYRNSYAQISDDCSLSVNQFCTISSPKPFPIEDRKSVV